MEDCRIARQVAEWNPWEKRRHSRSVRTWKDRIRDIVQRKSLKDEECFDRELWRKNMLCLWVEEKCIHRKIPLIMKINRGAYSLPRILLLSLSVSQYVVDEILKRK
jgi:hypothetical protein